MLLAAGAINIVHLGHCIYSGANKFYVLRRSFATARTQFVRRQLLLLVLSVSVARQLIVSASIIVIKRHRQHFIILNTFVDGTVCTMRKTSGVMGRPREGETAKGASTHTRSQRETVIII